MQVSMSCLRSIFVKASSKAREGPGFEDIRLRAGLGARHLMAGFSHQNREGRTEIKRGVKSDFSCLLNKLAELLDKSF